jgi:hypothetical protein
MAKKIKYIETSQHAIVGSSGGPSHTLEPGGRVLFDAELASHKEIAARIDAGDESYTHLSIVEVDPTVEQRQAEEQAAAQAEAQKMAIEEAQRRAAAEAGGGGGEAESITGDYEKPTAKELEGEVERRKAAGREINVEGTGSGGNVVKGDLVKALEADDKAASESGGTPNPDAFGGGGGGGS